MMDATAADDHGIGREREGGESRDAAAPGRIGLPPPTASAAVLGQGRERRRRHRSPLPRIAPRADSAASFAGPLPVARSSPTPYEEVPSRRS